jgi:hypothetical protein
VRWSDEVFAQAADAAARAGPRRRVAATTTQKPQSTGIADMALITDATTTWSAPVTLVSDEIWQTRYGSVFLTTTPGPAPDDGFHLLQGEGVLIRAGREVRYRKAGLTAALIVREAV